MKKTIAIMLLLAMGSMSLTACSSSGNDETTADHEATAGESGDPDVTVGPEDTEAPSDNDYGYPDSIACDVEPSTWSVVNGGYRLAVPGVYEDAMFGPENMYFNYQWYKPDEDTTIYFYVTWGSWLEEKPSWYESDSYTYSLEDVPEYLRPDLNKVFDGPGHVDHSNPFTDTNTDYTTLSEERVIVGDNEFIRREMSAYGHGYFLESNVYYTVCYGLSDHPDGSGINEKVPFFVIAVSADDSEETRQIMNDTIDYAITHFYS